MRGRLTEGERERIASIAYKRYTSGETWAQIAASFDLHPGHVRRLTTARHRVEFRRWGQDPVANADEVMRRRAQGESIQTIATALGCSRTAVRTAIELTTGAPTTRYPKLADRREPSVSELHQLTELYEALPPAPRSRPGHKDTAGEAGLELAIECLQLVDSGVPMQTLSLALGRGPTWVHWLLGRHGQRPEARQGRTTSRRTRGY